MRIIKFASLLGVAALTAVAGCVKDVDQPALAGPSTFAHSIVLVADRDTLTQNGVDFTDIRITSLSPDGTSENIQLRAQIYVDGVPNDFGTLSTKSPITPATIRYTAPPASSVTTAQVPTTVTIGVTTASSGDFRGESTRTVDINLQPVGIIIPTNPNLVAAFTFTPSAPKVAETVAFDASTTTNNGTACLTLCSYVWDFGDGSGGIGLTTTHEFRKAGVFPVKLTVTDPRGASASKTNSVTVSPGTPPTAVFTRSPTGDVGVNQPVFFDASASTPAAGRSIVTYEWNFGDGSFGQGVIVTHSYAAAGTYSGQLITIDDAGTRSTPAPLAVNVGQSSGPVPTAVLTCSPAGPRTASCNATGSLPGSGSNIESYTFNWGEGSPDEVQTNPLQTHVYAFAGTFTVTMTVRDTLGRTAAKQVTVTVTP